MATRFLTPCAMVVWCCAVGCRAPLLAERENNRNPPPSAAEATYQAIAQDDTPPATPAQRQASATRQATAPQPAAAEPAATKSNVPQPTAAQTAELRAALAELQQAGAIDAATEARLLEGLTQTDPALWPGLLAYLQAAAQRNQPTAEPTDSAPAAATPARSSEPDVMLAGSTVVSDLPAEPTVKRVSHTAAAPAAAEEPEDAAVVLASDEPAEPTAVAPSATAPPVAETPPAAATPASATETAAAPSTAPAPPATPAAAPAAEPPGDWRAQLALSIRNLEAETARPPATHAEISQHAALRMLYLVAGRREDALQPIAGISPAQQDFWAKEIYGLSTYLDHDRNPDSSRRAAEAGNHLREATARLGELATLQVRNLTFCREVSSYGVYKPFESQEFQPGQELLLYAEIENFKSTLTDQGYHTALKASYQILDERGARVDEKEFALIEEYCQNPRRDFFVRYFIWIPQRIYGGTYTLQLSVEDTLSQKIGQAQIDFKVPAK